MVQIEVPIQLKGKERKLQEKKKRMRRSLLALIIAVKVCLSDINPGEGADEAVELLLNLFHFNNLGKWIRWWWLVGQPSAHQTFAKSKSTDATL